METEEAETEEWVNTLRVSAALRGESFMAACTQSFAEHRRAATLLGEQQLEARASRTADVSQMEGPDGLLHCAVVKGEHALAARAAQFLVDKRGSNVNCRDEWRRCVCVCVTKRNRRKGRGRGGACRMVACVPRPVLLWCLIPSTCGCG